MTKDQIKAILALHKDAVNNAKEAYKEAENNCRENTFMDSGEADSYIQYIEGIEAVMEILDIPFPEWCFEDEDEDEDYERSWGPDDEGYEDQFGSEIAIRICRANNIPLSDIEKYGSDAYWINDGINNLQDLYDIEENYVIPTGDEDLIKDYRREILKEEE
jgi:hypothetical protein